MSLYAHRLARIIERRSWEAATPGAAMLGGMTVDEHRAANGLERGPYMGARCINRLRAVWGRDQ